MLQVYEGQLLDGLGASCTGQNGVGGMNFRREGKNGRKSQLTSKRMSRRQQNRDSLKANKCIALQPSASQALLHQRYQVVSSVGRNMQIGTNKREVGCGRGSYKMSKQFKTCMCYMIT